MTVVVIDSPPMHFDYNFVTVQQFLVGLRPHGGATAHAPEDDRVAAQEVRRQSSVQLPT